MKRPPGLAGAVFGSQALGAAERCRASADSQWTAHQRRIMRSRKRDSASKILYSCARWNRATYQPRYRLDKALDAAQSRRWTIVDMRRDWRRVFAFEK